MKARIIVQMNRFAAAAFLLALLMSSCVKDLSFEAVEPTIEQQAMASGTFALCSATVTYPGKITVEVEWSNSQDMSTPYRQTMENNGGSSYSTMLSGLSKYTTYYYRVTTSNRFLSRSSAVGQFTTLDDDTPLVTTFDVSSAGHNRAVGNGKVIFESGSEVTERGLCWSKDHNPTIEGGHVGSGTGLGEFAVTMTELEPNTHYYVRAYAVNSFGTGYGEEISFNTTTIPEGIIDSEFTVGLGKKVYFSQGNLRYQPSTGIWRFADKQYDLIHVYSDMTEGNGVNAYCNVSNEYTSSYGGWIDFFGWGTSGWNNGNVYYHPYDCETAGVPSQGYGPTNGSSYTFDLTGNYANADWGVYNSIANGGNQTGQWRTLTESEWNCILYSREAYTIDGVSNARFVKAKVNGVQGVIIFPDSYMHPSDVVMPVGINSSDETGWNNNIYSVADWSKIEAEGAVFLPAAGYRTWSTNSSILNGVFQVNSGCHYWTTTSYYWDPSYLAIAKSISDENMYNWAAGRAVGCSVRLVKDIN